MLFDVIDLDLTHAHGGTPEVTGNNASMARI